ncbi:isocitrate lyase/PEP mutase family protein [Microvirga antarctica]|uniref:isocitrate lyase/PEP mutase family protein n=1 Tax=Microvirga antarctica TaxID=2819233 RepID=UPI001B30575F|nr:isocitrate lyase/phosphoenolpyruvate mutase family protein [Microvirga antarctica]
MTREDSGRGDSTITARLSRGAILAPGICDALTASLATQAGAEALYLSGAAIAYTRLARPDVGLVSVSEVAEVIALIRDRVETPMIVDADTGYGNALNVQRTVRVFERAGANVIQLEDQTFPKRCGHLAEKRIVPAAEMVGKIRAAVDARHSQETLIIGRTDAAAIEGLEAAIARAHLYAEAGADILFVEAPKSAEQLKAIVDALGDVRPLLANMVEGGQTPLYSAAELGQQGFSIIIFPGGVVRAIARTAQDYYRSLIKTGSNAAFRDSMFDFDGLNDVIGTNALLALGKSYEDEDKSEVAETA